jgi:acetate kinase
MVRAAALNSTDACHVKARVIPIDEDLMIARTVVGPLHLY